MLLYNVLYSKDTAYSTQAQPEETAMPKILRKYKVSFEIFGLLPNIFHLQAHS